MKYKSSGVLFFLKGIIILVLLVVWIWGGLALFFTGPGPAWLKIALSCLFAAFLPGAFLLSRSFVKGLIVCFLIFTALVIWWQTLQPTNSKDWAADVSQISHGELEAGKLTMHNVRNFRYNGEQVVEQRWETREYDLEKLQGIDLFLSYWASDHIAHTILSWDFGENEHLAISIETRKDKTQEYSAVKGFFKQFELSYVAADESDIIRLRTNHRKERVYLYRLHVPIERSRALLENYVTEMNRLVNEPEFYDALTRNCTTTIHLHTNAIRPEDPVPVDWRLIVSGHLDELLYEKGVLSQNLPFAELRQKSRVDQRMREYDRGQFSRALRNEPGNRMDKD